MSDWHGYPQHPSAHPDRPWWRKKPEGYWLRIDGEQSVYGRKPESAMATLDHEHPLPPPEPRCGQVWRFREGHQAMVAYVRPDGSCAFAGAGEAFAAKEPWPYPGAVLVAGPGSPWAPMRGE